MSNFNARESGDRIVDATLTYRQVARIVRALEAQASMSKACADKAQEHGDEAEATRQACEHAAFRLLAGELRDQAEPQTAPTRPHQTAQRKR